VTCARCANQIEPDSTYCRFCGASVVGRAEPRMLTRLPDAGRIAGVCAGMAAYFNIDVTLVRLAWVVLSIVPGLLLGGVLAYVAAWLLLPASTLPPVPAASAPRLVRPFADRKIAGVCAGIARYIGVDTTAVRLLWVILSIYPGAIICGVIVYVVAWVIVPSEHGTPFEPIVSPSA